MIRLTALAALAAVPTYDAQGQTHLLHVRALVDDLPEPIIKTVAEDATPSIFFEDSQPQLREWPLRRMVESLCGSVQRGYLETIPAFAGQSPDLEAPLGSLAYDIEWPACLRITKLSGIFSLVRNGDMLGKIKQRFTGDGVDNIDAFYAETGLSLADEKTLQQGREIRIPFITTETRLEARSGNTQALASKLTELGRTTLSVKINPKPAGAIVMPVELGKTSSPGSIQGTHMDCRGSDLPDYPFDAATVSHAYSYMRARTMVAPLTAMVIDNGFFGVPREKGFAAVGVAGDSEADAARFPREIFDGVERGPVLHGLWPVNYANVKGDGTFYGAADVNAESGHGTHVAGLVLGGPAFAAKEQRALFYTNGMPWLTIVIGNLSGGKREIASGMETSLIEAFNAAGDVKVVNMSVAFDAKAYPKVIETLTSYLDARPNALFVAAAGNLGKPLQAIGEQPYPAMLSGKIPNVITVAAADAPVDGVAHLSRFSNRGAAADIAAPGCKIASWLDAGRPPEPISGTSQAAPLVSFAAILLRSIWRKADPDHIRIRLLASGDLLSKEHQGLVRSASQLNIAKALTFDRDRITFERSGVRRTMLGAITASLQGVSCDRQAVQFVALKRRSLTEPFTIFVSSGGEFQLCAGSVPANRKIAFTPTDEVAADGSINPAQLDAPITTSEVIEIVRAGDIWP